MGSYGYDSQCEKLAVRFLEDEAIQRYDTSTSRVAFVDQHKARLAQEIQDLIEQYIEYDAAKPDPAVS